MALTSDPSKEAVCHVVEGAYPHACAYYEHETQEYCQYPEVDIVDILSVGPYKKGGQDCKDPGYAENGIFLKC